MDDNSKPRYYRIRIVGAEIQTRMPDGTIKRIPLKIPPQESVAIPFSDTPDADRLLAGIDISKIHLDN